MVKKLIITAIVVFTSLATVLSQTGTNNLFSNSADQMLASDSKLTIGGYGEVHFNQEFDSETLNNADLDVHRLVLLFGYKFNDKIQFISEVEYEHVKEVYIEQAFIQYKLNKFIDLRAGLLLVPMGIINEYHEPVSFNGLERPMLDTYITPTTWREIGVGVSGKYLPASLKYQAYMINGFAGYNGEGTLSGKKGLRGGRQKGAESFMSSPNFTGKLEYFGIRSLNIGISGYYGDTQSSLYDGINKDDDLAMATADSSVVTVAMLGADARYSYKGLYLRGQYYLVNLNNTEQYNSFTAQEDKKNDLASSMTGYYAEVGYNVFRSISDFSSELIPFVRYEFLDTHASVDDDIVTNDAYERTLITTGLTWKVTPGSVVKADVQFSKQGNSDDYIKVLNLGFGVMF